MKLTRKIIKCWFDTWESTNQLTPWPKEVRKNLRGLGYDMVQLQDSIACAQSLPPDKRTDMQNELIHIHKVVMVESNMALSEELVQTMPGMIYEAKTIHNRIDKHVVKVEHGTSLSDIINDHSKQQGK